MIKRKKIFSALVLLIAIVAVVVMILLPNRSDAPLYNAHSNPILGMWQQCGCSEKSEIMFNEDYTGFVFESDTLFCEMQWRQDELLSVHYSLVTDSATLTTKLNYEVSFLNDTLLLYNVDSNTQSKFMRVR